jgi:hypothetical protein
MNHTPEPWTLESHSIVAHWEDGTKIQIVASTHSRFAHSLKETPGERARVDAAQARIAAEDLGNLRLMSKSPALLRLLRDWIAFHNPVDEAEWGRGQQLDPMALLRETRDLLAELDAPLETPE